jgi:RNA polymerase sigma factor (sigma-70 family)
MRPNTHVVGRAKRERSDQELLRASKAGQGGFDAFYTRHRDVILAFHARRVRDPEAALDLTAETFAAALAAIHAPDRKVPDAPLPWLFTIAHNKLVDSYRRGQIQDDMRRRLAMEPLPVTEDDLERVMGASDTDVLAELERRLPPDQFEAVRARVFDERDYAEIAEALQCSESVVRMRVSRGLRRLRVFVKEDR